MKKYTLALIVLSVQFGCISKDKDTIAINETTLDKDLTSDSKTLVIQSNLEDLGNDISWMHPEHFSFTDYMEHPLNDTINIDLNGNGILEKIYFNNRDHDRIFIDEKGASRIILGAKNGEFSEFPTHLNWVDFWSVVSDKKVTQVLFEENGPVIKDTIIAMEGPGIYIGREVLGGGIITYRKNKLSWIHQSYEQYQEHR